MLNDMQLIVEVLIGSLDVQKLLGESKELCGLERVLGLPVVSDLLSTRVKCLRKLVDKLQCVHARVLVRRGSGCMVSNFGVRQIEDFDAAIR